MEQHQNEANNPGKNKKQPANILPTCIGVYHCIIGISSIYSISCCNVAQTETNLCITLRTKC